MSLEHSPARVAVSGIASTDDHDGELHDFWFSYIDERAAAEFLGLVDRTLQAWRQRGGGPKFYLLSARCVRYRRVDLREWTEAKTRISTSDTGAEAA
ncbi:MAG: helix-turn-helix domain-containing protein [Kiloniellales bacterium]|nr:helix-turn-helix domain-containing protein [Kiloniellales bacterium]